MNISAILLASGLSRRMGSDKLLLELKGKKLMQHAIELLSELPVTERIIVTTDTRQSHVCIPPGISICLNPNPEAGQSGSIRLGVEAATGTHYLFLNADQPYLEKSDIIPLLEAAKSNPDKIIFPVIDSKPTSPAIFPGCFRAELLSLKGDTGGRVVRDANKEHCLEIASENKISFADIDSMEDLNDFI